LPNEKLKFLIKNIKQTQNGIALKTTVGIIEITHKKFLSGNLTPQAPKIGI